MSPAFILLALSASVGFAIGTSHSWFAILVSSVALAGLSAAVLQMAGFDALPGIAIIAGCLTVHQLATPWAWPLRAICIAESKKITLGCRGKALKLDW
jgi:hypothetical protein